MLSYHPKSVKPRTRIIKKSEWIIKVPLRLRWLAKWPCIPSCRRLRHRDWRGRCFAAVTYWPRRKYPNPPNDIVWSSLRSRTADIITFIYFTGRARYSLAWCARVTLDSTSVINAEELGRPTTTGLTPWPLQATCQLAIRSFVIVVASWQQADQKTRSFHSARKKLDFLIAKIRADIKWICSLTTH